MFWWSCLAQNRHLGMMKSLCNIDDSLKPLIVNEVMYAIDCDQVDTQCMLSENSSYNQHRITSTKTSNLIPGGIQIHKQVPLSNAKILKKKTKLNFTKCSEDMMS